MALSGSYSINFPGSSNHSLIFEWSATQSITNNTSTITMKTYFSSKAGYNLNASNIPLQTWIDGYSENTKKNISTSGGKKILLNTRTKTINHSSDGTRVVNLRAILDMNGVYSSGRNLGKADTGAKSVTLNTIPRKSTLTSAKSFTATNDYSCTVDRSSTVFIHKLIIKHGSQTLKTVSDITTSKNISFTQEENEKFLQLLGTNKEITLVFLLETWKSGYTNMVGSNTYNIRLFNPGKSKLTSLKDDYNIGEQIVFDIDAYKNIYKHNIRYSFAGITGIIATNVIEGRVVWDTSLIKEKLFNAIPNTHKETVNLILETYYGNTKIEGDTIVQKTLRVVESYPIFTGDNITLTDYNTSSNNITQDSYYFIQGISKIRVYIPSTDLAQPQNGATIKKYIVRYDQQTVESLNIESQYIDFPIEVGSDNLVFITAVDSRGTSNTIAKSINILLYDNPRLSIDANRNNGFDEPTTVNITINYSPLIVKDVEKNPIVSCKCFYGLSEQTLNNGENVALTTINNTRKKGTHNLLLDKTNRYIVKVEVTDKLGKSSSVITSVDKGVPIISVDEDRKSIGINGFPREAERLEIMGEGAIVDKELCVRDEKQNKMCGMTYDGYNNKLFFYNREDDTTERNPVNLNVNSIDIGELIIKEDLGEGRSIIRCGDEIISFNGNKELWSGALYPASSFDIELAVPIYKCPNGWMLIWSDYSASNGTANDYDWNITYIHKNTALLGQTVGLNQIVGTGLTTDDTKKNTVVKYIYVTNGGRGIKGHGDNGGTNLQRSVVLRKIYVW